MDEDVAVEVSRSLQQAGHEVSRVADVLGVRTDDVDIWHHAVRTESIVVTCNRQDFLALAGNRRHHCQPSPDASGRMSACVGVVDERRRNRTEVQHQLRVKAEGNGVQDSELKFGIR